MHTQPTRGALWPMASSRLTVSCPCYGLTAAHPLICSCSHALSYVSLQDAMLSMSWNLTCALPLVPATHALLSLLAARLA